MSIYNGLSPSATCSNSCLELSVTWLRYRVQNEGKIVPVMAIEAYEGLQQRLYLFLTLNAKWSGQLQAPTALLPGKELGRPHNRCR